MKVTPLQKYVLLEVLEYEEPKSGLILLDKTKKKIPRGKVLAKGGYADCDCDIGDTVIYSKAGTKALPNNLVLCPDAKIHLKL